MICPICDQKTINCDCTEMERRQHAEIEELRLTDEEREAVAWAVSAAENVMHPADSTLRKLLERLS